MDASERSRLLNKFADLVERDCEYLADLETYNNGMNTTLSRTMTKNMVQSTIRYIASLADKVQGDTIPVGKWNDILIIISSTSTSYHKFAFKKKQIFSRGAPVRGIWIPSRLLSRVNMILIIVLKILIISVK